VRAVASGTCIGASFFEYKQRFQTHGLEGLKDMPPIPKPHPMPPEGVVAQILELKLVHPAWGCVRLSNHLSCSLPASFMARTTNIWVDQVLEIGQAEAVVKLQQEFRRTCPFFHFYHVITAT
jgi:hypothetical protein